MRKTWKEAGLGVLSLLVVVLAVVGMQPLIEKYLPQNEGARYWP